MSRTVTMVLLVLMVVVAFAAVGEYHRHNCVQEGRTSCSVLLWDNGVDKRNPFDR